MKNHHWMLGITILMVCHHMADSFVPVPTSSLQSTVSTLQSSSSSSSETQKQPLCDLQTLLKLTGVLPTGGSVKVAIQSGDCQLNGVVETRRAKKLFPGDIVTFDSTTMNVESIVQEKKYVYKVKVKKIKPEAKVDEYGNKEFGGRFRSQEWRAERLQKKVDRNPSYAGRKKVQGEGDKKMT